MPASPSRIEQLAAELQTLAYYGVGHAMGDLSEDDIPNLSRIARRLAPDAKNRLRVSIARAVREAVLLIDPEKHAHAAAELLWLDLDDPTDFEEDRSRRRKPLRERHPVVAALLGQALSAYERYKGWQRLYEQVAANLLTLVDQVGAIKPASSAPPVADAPYLHVAEAAANLFFATLTALFVADFHNKLAEGTTTPCVPRIYDWADSAEWLFICYSDFFAQHSRYTYPLSDGIDGDLDKLTRLARQHDPFRELSGSAPLLAFASELARGSKDFSSAHAFDSAMDELDKEIQNLADAGRSMQLLRTWHERIPRTRGNIFQEGWMPWYQSQFNVDSWPPPSDEVLPTEDLLPYGIVVLAAISELYLEIITEHVDLNRPVLAHARQRAHRIISSFYDVDAWQPLGAGGSLKEYIDYFFDKAMRPAACESRRNMVQM